MKHHPLATSCLLGPDNYDTVSLPLVSVRDSPNLCSTAACLLECLHQLLCQGLVYVRFNPMSDYTKHSFRPCRSPF